MVERPDQIVVITDGWDSHIYDFRPCVIPTSFHSIPKHEPGKMQPRNVGVRILETQGFDYVWFVDSDLLFDPAAYANFKAAADIGPRIMVGPYDWMPPGVRTPLPSLQNDPRWIGFNENEPTDVLSNNLAAGLACFSGNLMWPLADFKRVGGFWDELHHGRCEDGELGLRAVAAGMGVSYVRGARAWHMHHEINYDWVVQANARDVPMLNERHPWMEGRCACGMEMKLHTHSGCPELDSNGDDDEPCSCGAPAILHTAGEQCNGFQKALFVVDEDGKRFNTRCICGWEGNSAEIWAHQAAHQ